MFAHTLEIELPWPPTGNNATRHTRTGGHYKTAQAVAYRTQVARTIAALKASFGLPLAGPLTVSWILSPPDRRARDVDNARKELADALTLAGLWTDDSNKVIRSERFQWTDPEPGGRVYLSVSQ